MTQKQIRAFGTWNSPVTTELVAGKTLRFGNVQSDGMNVFWSEARPYENGRCVIMRSVNNSIPEEILPFPYSTRSKIHEYGGGEFSVFDDDVFFVNGEDQDIYHLKVGANPSRITNVPDTRFADIAADRRRDRVIAVAEAHLEGVHHPDNILVSVSMNGEVTTLHRSNDFYAYPRISPDGDQIAWISWDLPDMPWDSAALFLADFLEDGSIGEARLIAGGYDTAVYQPEWGPDGRLYYVSDESGIGNIYAFDGETAESVCFLSAEFGRPLWSLGSRSYDFADGDTIIAACLRDGNLDVVRVDIESGNVTSLDTSLRAFDNLICVNGKGYGIGAGDFIPSCIGCLDSDGGFSVIRASTDTMLEREDVSVGIVKRMRSCVPDEDIYGIYYPPANGKFTGPENENPPLIMMVHGGPTGYADRGFKMKVQYWTSRGFAVFDLDYSGSYGYGRDYMERLNGQWGIRDVQDVQSALEYLVDHKLVNKEALFISGGSAGGFTVLLALAELDMFAGGACSYGVADLVHLQECTHKFEGGYLFRLMGVEVPEDWSKYNKKVFIERSPTTKAHKISMPVIFFQGLEDKVVPPEQTRSMVAVLEKQGRQVISLEFEGEGHGFRKADTVKTVLEQEHIFYLRQMGLETITS